MKENPFLKNLSGTFLAENEIGAVLTQNIGSRKSKLYDIRSNYFKDLLLKSNKKNKIVDYNSIELKYWGKILPNEDYIDESSYLGLMVENAASVAISGDIPAMMNGVEVRCPFLDSEIINFAFNCKWDKKINSIFNSQNLKKILRDAVCDIIPENLLKAPKRGFGFGITEKSLLQGEWACHAERVLNNFPENTVIDPVKVKNIWNSAQNNKNTSWDIIMKLLNLGMFLDSQ